MHPSETPITVAEYLARTPSEVESVRASVAPFRDLSPAQRWAELATLNGWLGALLAAGAGSPSDRDGEHPFWRHWVDPHLGRPA